MRKVAENIKSFAYKYRAIFFIVGLASASIAGVIHLFTVSNNHNVELVTQSCLNIAQEAFNDMETNTGRMLSAALEVLLTNNEIGAQFAKRNRENLYRLTRPVFEHLKKRNNITHWYFLNPEPEKTCFLRVHAPYKYNDIITRVTLGTSIKTKEFAFGKELGKTALALRAVHPYYYKNQLIGYIEMGMEMEDFFKVLSKQTGNEYGLLIKKEFLEKSKWTSITAEKKIPNNWDDMEYLLLVNQTSDNIHLLEFKEKFGNPGNIPDNGIVLEKLTINRHHFARGIFPFYDAAGRKVGGVFIRKDITPIYNAMLGQKQKIVLLILFFMGLITFFMVFFHKRAEKELRTYRTRLEEMVKESTAELLEINKRLNLEIEEHKRAQEALQDECKAREEAEEKQLEAVKHAERSTRMASIGVMAAGVTHEINQPLNAIKVTADSIQYWHRRNPGVLPQDFVDQLGIITKSVKRIVEIIQHMRAFWVVPHAPGVSDVNINQAVKNALSLTRQQMLAHGINQRLQLDTASPAPVFKGNLIHIEQIIVNLLVNAIHALDEKNSNNKEITVTSRQKDQWVVLEIADNGPGLPEVDVNKLFDPFFSTNTGGEGMGLGLAIVKRYIDKYNGTIEVRNRPEGGAVFTIKFPVTESPDEQEQEQEKKKEK